MTKKRSTKRALLLSALSLLMCVSMLVGSTFAWFTDEVTSSGNKIVSGKLDVDLIDANGVSLENETLQFVDKDGKEITSQILWEPGCTYTLEPVRVKNNGNLWLKYEIVISGIEGDAKLLEVIEWTIMLGDEKVALADLTGYLEPEKTSDALQIIGHMKEDAGNEYQELEMDGISITVYATQYTKESDSFDDQYDKDAVYTDAVVTSEEELKDAIAKAKNGAIIGIDGNVSWTTGAEHGSTPFANAAKNITLVGMNEAATFTATGKGVGPIGIDNGTVTFKNLKIVDESVSYKEGSWEFGYLEFRGSTVFENCNIVNAIMMEGDSAIFKNCKFNSNKPSEYAVWVSDGDASFEGCTFTGTRGLKTHEAYGSEVGTIVVNNNKFVEISEKPGMAIGTVNADTAITLTNNEFIGTQAGDQGLYSYETDTDVTTFNFTYKDNKVIAQDSALTQGLYKVDDSTWMASNTNALNQGISKAEDGQTVVLSQDVVYSGSGYANITKDITLDLNGNTLSTTSFGVVAKAGTIKNGVVSNPVGSRAALRTWSGVAIENVVVESPENGGITVASGNALPSIKNVTIKAKTYGIELQNYASVETIENVTIDAGENGIVVQAGTIGNITNSVIKGGNAGIYGQLKGTNDLKISVDSTNKISGGKYGIYLCDEGATIVPDGIAYLTYSEAATIEGGLKDKEFAFAHTDKLIVTVDGVPYVAANNTLKAVIAAGATKVMLADGEYDLNGIQKDGLTLIGVGNEAKVANTTRYAGGKAVGAITKAIKLENVTITNTVYTMENGSNATFTNVNFAAGFRQGYGTGVVFTDCTFGSNSEGYALHFQTDATDASGKIQLNGCKFEGGKVHLGGKRAYEFTGCDFAAGTDFQVWSDVALDGCTVNGEKVTTENMATLFPKLDVTKVTIK